MELSDLLAFTVKSNASDLHLSSRLPPLIRIDGEIRRTNIEPFSPEQLHKMLYGIMNDVQIRAFEEFLEVDFAVTIPNAARFRVNVFTQMRGAAAVFRVIPSRVTPLAELGAPPVFHDLAMRHQSLVLVTGPAGSGKSTTLAAMVDAINEGRRGHILTIEDPIEFVHAPNNCIVNQRELGAHTRSFAAALKSSLREDPNVVMIGELRDLETIRLALTAAETGHLVLASLHTTSAAKSVDRIIDAFPADEKSMVRTMLAESLGGVISQQLLPKKKGGRVAAWEVMLGTPAIRNLIRENKVPQMASVLQTGQTLGMQTMDQALLQLLRKGVIAREAAISHASDPDKFAAAVRG